MAAAGHSGCRHRGPRPAAANSLAAAASLCGLASISLLAAMPRLIYSGFLGWLDLPTWLKLLLRAPLGLAIGAVALQPLKGIRDLNLTLISVNTDGPSAQDSDKEE